MADILLRICNQYLTAKLSGRTNEVRVQREQSYHSSQAIKNRVDHILSASPNDQEDYYMSCQYIIINFIYEHDNVPGGAQSWNDTSTTDLYL